MERDLRQILESGTWTVGDRLPSEQDLSRRFGVSAMTMRQALASLVADGLVRRVVGKGTFVLRTSGADARPSGTGTVAIAVPKLWEGLDPYYFPDVLSGFRSVFEEAGREVAILDYESVAAGGRLQEGSAVACLLLTEAEERLAEDLKDRGYRVLGVNRYRGRRAIPFVAPDNEGGVAEATEMLIAQGHRSIAFLRGAPGNLDASDRLRGYRRAMRAAGLPTTEAGNGFGERFGHQAAFELLRSPNPPTALVAASDLAAIGALHTARELGIEVPSRLSVVGFGNFTLISFLEPKLTTVNLPRTELGRTAARMLVSLAQGESVETALLPARLVAGATHHVCPSIAQPG